MRRCPLLLGVLALIACSPAPIPSPSTSPSTTTTAGPLLAIAASGTVGCEWMLGCAAFVAIEPTSEPDAPLPEAWRPADPIVLSITDMPEGGRLTLEVGAPADPPATIAPGSYRVVAAWAFMDDVPSAGEGLLDITSLSSTCSTGLDVAPAARQVEIQVTFALEGTCAVAAAAA